MPTIQKQSLGRKGGDWKWLVVVLVLRRALPPTGSSEAAAVVLPVRPVVGAVVARANLSIGA